METFLIDSHCHLGMLDGESRQAILKRAEEARVRYLVTVSTHPKDCHENSVFASQEKNIYFTIGIHPHEVALHSLSGLTESFFKQRVPERCVGIGETGLDYFYEHSPKETQKKALEEQIELAKKYDLPLVIHCREAFNDFFDVVSATGLPSRPGIFHCFTGNYEEAKRGIDLGFKISFSGIVTFKKAKDLQETCKRLPLSELMLETDCPFLAPEPHRGKPNEPSYIVHTAQFVASLKGVPFEEVAKITSQNTMSVFKIRE